MYCNYGENVNICRKGSIAGTIGLRSNPNKGKLFFFSPEHLDQLQNPSSPLFHGHWSSFPVGGEEALGACS